MNIRNKLFIIIIAVAAINLFFFVSMAFLNTRDFLNSAIANDLDHLAEARKNEIEHFLEDIETNLFVAQGYHNFKKNLPVVDRLKNNKLNKEYIESKEELDGQMLVLQDIKKFRNIILLNKSGEVVYFSNPNLIEEYKIISDDRRAEIFEVSKEDVYLSDPLKDSRGELFLLAVSPVRDFNGDLIGEMVFDVGVSKIFDAVQSTRTLGETGEVVIGKKINDKEILILNPLRHETGAALNKKILIGNPLGYGIQQAIKGLKGFGVIIDYRGVESFASWHNIERVGWGIVVKTDTEEAFAPIVRLRNILGLLISIEALILIFFIYFIAKSITNPLIKLQRGMEKVADGDLSLKLATKSKDEVGKLSRAFDDMIEKLKDVQFRYSKLIETTPLCIKVFDPKGKLVFINRGGKDEHFLKDDVDITNWDWLGTIKEPYKKMAEEKLKDALRGNGSVFDFEHTPEGSKHKWCSSIITPLKDKDGKVSQVLFYSADITMLRNIAENLEKKVFERTLQIASEKEKFSTLVEQLPVGVVMVRASDGNLIELNKVAEGFLGKKASSLIERGPFSKLITFVKSDGSSYPVNELPMSSAIKKGEPSIKEDLYVKKPNGELMVFRGMAVPVKDDSGNVSYGVGVLEDITKEKNIEKMRTDFLSLASHQLRTPLSGTKWLVETLKMEKFGTLNPKQKQYLDELEHVNERMIRLVFDMLNALRFESGSYELKTEKATASEITANALGLLDSAAKKKSISIQDLPEKVGKIIIESDISLIKRVMEALVSNSIEYSSPGQGIILGVKEEAGNVIFSVRDFGIGIPEEEKGKIKERFYRASNAKAIRPDGTGLGLYIASMLADKIDGKITFESKEKEGSTFYLSVSQKNKL